MAKDVKDYIQDMIILFENNAWIQGYNAKDLKNELVAPTSKDACKFCINGAIAKVTNFQNDEYKKVLQFLKEAIREEFNKSLISFNDDKTMTKEKVLDFLKKKV